MFYRSLSLLYSRRFFLSLLSWSLSPLLLTVVLTDSASVVEPQRRSNIVAGCMIILNFIFEF